ncbi:MAG: squalene--hopene cyclase, partial [Stellaceae bacterium]
MSDGRTPDTLAAMADLDILVHGAGDMPELTHAIERATGSLLALQKPEGHWVFELEADATIPAEYILLQHYLDEILPAEQSALATYLRATQGVHGGWPLFHGGAFDLSASVKAYFALKAAGDSIEAPHMLRARTAILGHGGAANANVFTRVLLALFGEIGWNGVPVMPIEIMLLPRWFPFHLDKVSYWSRTVIVPLLVLLAKKPRAKNPRGIHIAELFVPGSTANPPRAAGSVWATLFNGLDDVLRHFEPRMPPGSRARATERAVAWVTERLNGEDGLGAIFPAMANAVMMFECLGCAKDDPRLLVAKEAIRKLLVLKGDGSYCQPCVSPVWDTSLAAHALLETGDDDARRAVGRALDWLVTKQETEVVGDWASRRPGVPPGGWAFQYANPHYPDVDDTAVVAMALNRFDRDKYRGSVARGAEWIEGMQSRNGGWGSFDADNTHYYLNYIPFADHGALLDPPTADVSARCIGLLAQIERKGEGLDRAVRYLLKEQEANGSWFGRWGTNYIYGTWSALTALAEAGVPATDPMIRQAVEWLRLRQNGDGGWGESNDSYADRSLAGGPFQSTPYQ